MKEESLEAYIHRRHTKGTSERYLRAIKEYHQRVGERVAEKAMYRDIVAYIGSLRGKYKNAQTLNCVLHGLKKYYAWLLDTGKRIDHPCRYLHLRDQVSKDIQLQDLFSDQELSVLLNRKERYPILELKNKSVLSLLVYQGLTTGEIKSLEVKDINVEKGTVKIKGSRRLNERELKLKSEQALWLYRYMQEVRPVLLKGESSSLLFVGKGGRLDGYAGAGYLLKVFKKEFKGRVLNAKTIRQSVITNKLKEGHDLRVVQYFAGHKYPSSTEKYKQSDVSSLQQAVDRYHPLR